MAENGNAEKVAKTIENLAPVCAFDNQADYEYGFSIFTSKEKTIKGSIVWAGPKNLDGLAETDAFKFMAERYDMTPAQVFTECLGRLATKPKYEKSETDDDSAIADAHKAAQELADAFKYNERKKATTKFSAKILKIAADAGIQPHVCEDMLAEMAMAPTKAQSIIKKYREQFPADAE